MISLYYAFFTLTPNKHQDESDDEEKRALLAEENIQQLEDAEKVSNRDAIYIPHVLAQGVVTRMCCTECLLPLGTNDCCPFDS